MAQSSGNVLAALKRQPALGTPAASGAGAFALPIVDTGGLAYRRGEIVSGRRPRNQIRHLPRLGAASVEGSYDTELLVGGAIDLLLESIARGTWEAPLALNASVTTTANTIVRATGSWITDGLRVGDVITLDNDTTTANNDIRLRVVSLTATTITVAGNPLTADAVARAVDVTRLKKVVTPAVPEYHLYTIEQYDADIDESELFYDVRLTGLELSMQPNAMVTAGWAFSGIRRDVIDTVAAPYYTNPTELSGVSLVADDSWIRYKGQDVASLTGLDLSFAIASALQPTIGSIFSPDVFMNDLTVTGSITAVRESLQALRDFDAETEFEISVLLREPGADPAPVVGLYMPRVKITNIDAPFLGGDGAKVETRTIAAGVHPGDTDADAAAFAFFSSGA